MFLLVSVHQLHSMYLLLSRGVSRHAVACLPGHRVDHLIGRIARRHRVVDPKYTRAISQQVSQLIFVAPLVYGQPVTRATAAAAAVAGDTPVPSQTPGNLTGTWVRDNEASDLAAYDRMLELMQLSGLQRTTALRLIEGVELMESDNGLTIKFLTVVPFFKVTEEVAFGKQITQSRRDLRPGDQTARAARLANGVYVEMTWGDPLPGQLAETYYARGDTLYVESEVTIQGRKERTKVVYRRNTLWRPRFSFP